MPKRETMTVAITPTQRKFRGPNIGPKFRKEKGKQSINFTSGKNFQSILCQTNHNYYLIVILEYTSGIVHAMVDILANQKKVLTRCIEHQQDSIKGNWESSGATGHTRVPWTIQLVYPTKIAIMSNLYKRKLREALEINRHKPLNKTNKTFKVLNRDNGDYVTTKTWKPLFLKIGNH